MKPIAELVLLAGLAQQKGWDVHNQSPDILLPTGRVERKLILGPNVGNWDFGVTTGKCFRPARATRQGGR